MPNVAGCCANHSVNGDMDFYSVTRLKVSKSTSGASRCRHAATQPKQLYKCVRVCAGRGVTVCDKLQCVCDKTTAQCMAAARFNHSLVPGQCQGPAPSCRPAELHPSPESSEENVGGASLSQEDDRYAFTSTSAPTPPAAAEQDR